jgi:hypothetical protein
MLQFCHLLKLTVNIQIEIVYQLLLIPLFSLHQLWYIRYIQQWKHNQRSVHHVMHAQLLFFLTFEVLVITALLHLIGKML